MPSNIWTLVSGRNESSNRIYLPIMHCISLAVILLVSTCLADENASYKKAMIMKEAEDNIRWLRQAKEQVEREEREKNSLATLTDLMIKDSFDSQLMSKIDILYDNQTDLNKELKFVPQVFNCGKEFDIFKVLELAKAHRNITTEHPPCLTDEDDNMCSTKKAHNNSNPNKVIKNTDAPQSKEATGKVHAFAVQSAISTKSPSGQTAAEKRTEPPALRQPSANPQTKTAKLKPQNKEKPSPVQKLLGGKVAPNYLQKQFEPKGIFSKPAVAYRRFSAEPSLDDVEIEENPRISEDQSQRWYAAQVEQNDQYSSIENQNKNDDQLKSQEPQVKKSEAPAESFQQQVKRVQSPMIQTVLQQTKTVEQFSPSQVVEQPQVQNVVMDEKSLQKQSGLKQTSEVSKEEDQAGQRGQQAGPIANMHDQKKQNLEKKGSGITQVQQQPQQLAKQAPVQQFLTQPQYSDQQKHFNQHQLQTSEKLTQQQPQPLEKQNQQQPQPFQKQNQQQPQPLEKQNQQQPQILEKQNKQQTQSLEKQNQQQLQIAEQRNQQQFQTFEKQNQQQHQTLEKQNKQQHQTLEKQNQQQLQNTEQQKQQQLQTMEKNNPQLQTSQKDNEPQLQIIEKQPPAVLPTVTDSERQQPVTAAVHVSEQQATQKTSLDTNEQQLILKQQTLVLPRIEQNQQGNKTIENPIVATSVQQAAQLPDPQLVVKLSSEAPNKALPESIGEKLNNSNSDKTMMSAPINVMVMEPNLNSSYGNTTSKVNLLGNIPATVYFWGNTMAHTPKIQNCNSLKTEQNKAASVTNKLESSDIPGNIQENPKGDYLYYQDQY